MHIFQIVLHEGIRTPVEVNVYRWNSDENVETLLESLTVEVGKHYVLFPIPQDDVRCEVGLKRKLGLSRRKWMIPG